MRGVIDVHMPRMRMPDVVPVPGIGNPNVPVASISVPHVTVPCIGPVSITMITVWMHDCHDDHECASSKR
jgi:hypothetical protein